MHQISTPSEFHATGVDWPAVTLHWKTCADCAAVIAEFQQLDDLIERTGPRFATASFLDSTVAAMVDARNDSDFKCSQTTQGSSVRLVRGLSESHISRVPIPLANSDESSRATLIRGGFIRGALMRSLYVRGESGSSVVSQYVRRKVTPAVAVFTTAAAVAIAGIVLFVTPAPLPSLYDVYYDVHGGTSSGINYKYAESEGQVLGGWRMLSTGGVAGVELPLAPTDRAVANARMLASIKR